MARKLHDPGKDEAQPKRERASGIPGRLGGMEEGPISDLSERGKSETSDDGAGCIYIHGDGSEVSAEVEYQVRAQTGTTAGAGKRLAGTGMGTRFGLPLDEPRHGEVKYVEREPVEGGNIAINKKRKLQVTE
jgi:hypothetical protein